MWKFNVPSLSEKDILQVQGTSTIYFGPCVYPMGSIVITLVHLSDSWSVSPFFSSETFHEVGGQESKESDKVGILNKNIYSGIKCQELGYSNIFPKTGH